MQAEATEYVTATELREALEHFRKSTQEVFTAQRVSISKLKKKMKDLTAENKHGIRPWDVACQQKNLDLMTYLLRVGGAKACKYETFLTRSDGRKILHSAIDANKWELVELLFSAAEKSQSRIRFEERRDNLVQSE